jgi:CBS-domain-containing membrane protein
MSAKVADVMSMNVVAVRKDAPFKETAARFRKLGVSAFPVLDDDGIVVGVVSETDLMPKEALQAGHEGHSGLSRLRHRRELGKAKAVTAADLMSRPPVTVGPYDLVSHAAHLMYDRKINHLPVVGQGGKLLGILSRADVLRIFDRPDGEIYRAVTEGIILRQHLADPADFTVSVQDGIVTLRGTPETASLGRAIVSEALHLEGVVTVRDEMTYPVIEPVLQRWPS